MADETFAERLRSLRKQTLHRGRSLSQEKLASLADVGRRQIFFYEKGLAVPSLGAAKRIASILGVSVDYLCDSTFPERNTKPD